MMLIKIFLFTVSLSMIMIGLIMMLPHKLTKKHTQRILQYGLIHFTTSEAAELIMTTSAIKSGGKNHCTYFFQNSTVPYDSIIYNDLENKNTKIVILNLIEQQLNDCKIRYNDLAIIHNGDFVFSDNNIIYIDSSIDTSPIITNLFFYNKITSILLLLGIIFIVLLLLSLL